MRARIYKPAKTATQSGFANTKRWVLEYFPETPRRSEPLMGWVASGDTLNQVKMRFHTRDEAVAFAERHGLDYVVEEPHERRRRPRNYLQNFGLGLPQD
jgi:hypothetical protein